MTEPLKPCPFCGSDRVQHDDWDYASFYIRCLDCNAIGPQTYRDNGGEAALWNRRAADDSEAGQ